MQKTLSLLIKKLYSDEWETALATADELGKSSDPLVVKALINVLDSDCATARNAAALALRDLKDNKAVKPLLHSIYKPNNKNNRSTLLYSLETLDCSEHFLEIFQLAMADKVDVRLSALNILDEQNFYLDSDDIKYARGLLEKSKILIDDQELYTILEEILMSFEEE